MTAETAACVAHTAKQLWPSQSTHRQRTGGVNHEVGRHDNLDDWPNAKTGNHAITEVTVKSPVASSIARIARGSPASGRSQLARKMPNRTALTAVTAKATSAVAPGELNTALLSRLALEAARCVRSPAKCQASRGMPAKCLNTGIFVEVRTRFESHVADVFRL